MNNLRGVYTLWLRDVKRFLRDKARILGATAPPLLWLFIIGTGINKSFTKVLALEEAKSVLGKGDYIFFLYPGIIGMALLFTSIFSAASIIWDREFGFLKEVLVAPISRSAVAIGRALGGSTVAMFQGSILLLLAPLVKVNLTFPGLISLVLFMFLLSFSLTSLGIVIAARMRSMEGFQMVMNFLTLPMFFLSGAIFPLKNLPSWLDLLVQINPLTYGVDLLRYIMGGFNEYPLGRDLLVIVGFGLVMIALAVWEFNQAE